jgi:hypothetical protein
VPCATLASRSCDRWCSTQPTPRALAEFYRCLLGYEYQPGDEPPPPGEDDPKGQDWLALVDPSGAPRIAFQNVDTLAPATWPDSGVSQQLHLDLTVRTEDELARQHPRALELGARMLRDLSDDPLEPLYVYADPEGHPFCIFVVAG